MRCRYRRATVTGRFPAACRSRWLSARRRADTRCLVETSLWEHGVPVQEVSLRERRDQLRRPMPLRGDLREQMFSGATKIIR